MSDIKSVYDMAAKCPFYRGVKQKRIFCESFLYDDCTISLGFQNNDDMMIQLNTFCCYKYENCEVYQMIFKAEGGNDDV